MNSKIDLYFAEGCGRCSLWRTPQCKVHSWQEEMKLLREILLDCGLTEELKWKMPCYTFNNSNVALMSAFKEYCAISFFKGALLKDEQGLLDKPGENSQAVRFFRVTEVNGIHALESTIKAYIHEAIELEKAGLKVEFKKETEPIPEEFQKVLEENPAVKEAFNRLTRGRQRAYILHFSQPKQSKTRESRIEKSIPLILEGIGLYDNYKC
ncbi:MAG: YdeI/OmpD-associated family protein [Deferribacteres bacterium]|nr:YdeI/OmpD-associated family protein [candidate division KSB1 bacterium]MCB9504449.1 YdeI/OmpD-associated family protein [Deferribacteres bacterium]